MKRLPMACAWREQTLIGTWHRPDGSAHSPAARIGLLLLNTGPAPRSGNSDLSARIADRLAGRGLPAFRFDLPGLGDSTGPSWTDIDAYWQAVQRGCNDEAVVALVDEICGRHGLDGLILGGHCAGAAAAARVAATLAHRLAGLVLIEPIFRQFVLKPARESLPAPADGDCAPGNLRRLLARLMRSRRLAPLRRLLGHLREAHRARALPEDVQKEAVSGWRQALESGIPSLLILGQGLGADRYVMRIERTFPRFPSGLLRHALLPGVNHLLTSGDAPRLTMEAIEAWMEERFPTALGPIQAAGHAAPATASPEGHCQEA